MLKTSFMRMFAPDGAGAGDPGTGAPAATPPQGTPPAGSAQPPAPVTFTAAQLAEIDRITGERTSRAEQGALKSYFTQQGLSEEQAAEAIKAYKEANKAKVTPEAQALIDAANQKATEALTQANTVLIKADATVLAGTLQIRSDRVDTILGMADMSKVKVEDGKVDSAAVKAALEAVLARFPEWKTEGSTPSTPGFRVGSDGGQPAGADENALRRAFGLKPRA